MRHLKVPSNLGQLQLSVSEYGARGRPVLLVHGFTGAKEEFTDLAQSLAGRGWHAATVDLRGHGASDQPADRDAYDLDAFASDVVSVADALGWARFSLLGHSMGGAVAQRVALDHPSRLDALVLMSTFHGPVAVDPQLVALGVAIVTQGGMEALAAAQAARRQGDSDALAARERMEQARPGYGEWSDSKLLRCSPEMWLAMAPRFPAWPDTLAELPGLANPTLVLVGSDDETMRPQCEALAAAIPGAQLVVLPGVRHSPHLEAPAACLDAVSGFLDATPAV